MRILLVEDDVMIGTAVRQGLVLEGYAVDWVQNGAEAELALSTTDYEVVLLDLGLPDKSGLEVLSTLRHQGNDATVLIVTARDAVAERIEGLDRGADDYLVKPFDLDELSARIRAVQRRRSGHTTTLLTHGALSLNPANRECLWQQKPIILSTREFNLLKMFLDYPQRVLSHEQLEEQLYGWGEEIGSNTIEVHIHNLRKKLDRDIIKTIRGVGYTLGPAL